MSVMLLSRRASPAELPVPATLAEVEGGPKAGATDGRDGRDAAESASVALGGCRLDRILDGRVELVEAVPRNRRFPVRVTETLGVCLKAGPAHRVVSDGRALVYPADAVCVRPPGCVWSTDATGPAGFVSVDVAPSLLPRTLSRAAMSFADPRAVPDVCAVVHALRARSFGAPLEELVARLLVALGDAGTIAADELRASAPAHASRRAREVLERSIGAPPSLDTLSREVGLSRYALLRRFKRDFGVTPHAFVLRLRVERARERLASGGDVGEIALALGFADQPHFTRVFKAVVGVTPGAYARQVRAVVMTPAARTFVQDRGARRP